MSNFARFNKLKEKYAVLNKKKYKKKSIQIETVELKELNEEHIVNCLKFMNQYEKADNPYRIDDYVALVEKQGGLIIETLNGECLVSKGDYIVKNVKGEFYHCKPDIFEMFYGATKVKHQEHQYLDLIKHILEDGEHKEDRTGTGTKSVFGYQMRFDLSKGFPLLTTKKVYWKGLVEELLWFIKGDTDIKYLVDRNVHIWTPDAYRDYVFKGGNVAEDEFKEYVKKYGYDLGPIYGRQWRSWNEEEACDTIDQLTNVINDIKINPNSRRLIVNAWNVGDLDKMALPPCHMMFQFYVSNGKLSCQLYQRSADVFLGVPFNIASYALLTHMIAHECGLEVGEFIHTFGDAHIYNNHIEQVQEQISRDPKPFPSIKLNPDIKSVFDFKFEDIELIDYNPHPLIKGKVSVG